MGKLIVLVFLLFCGVAQATDQQYKVEGGKLLFTLSPWSDTKVKVSPEAEKYPDAVAKAYESGKLVEVARKTNVTGGKMVDLFHHKHNTTVSHISVVYQDQAEKSVIDAVSEEVVEPAEAMLNPYLIFWLASVVAMFVGGRAKNLAVARAICAIAAICAIGTFISTSFALIVTASLASAISIALAFVVADANKKMYKFFNRVFYLLMILSAGIVYYPLFL